MRLTYYRDKKKEWRWRLIARNGRKIATSGEGYKRLDHTQYMANKICGHLLDGQRKK